MKLKTCPFCGGEAELCQQRQIGKPDFGFYTVACKTCDCPMYSGASSYPTEYDAVTAWNRRAGEENVQA